MAQLNFYIPVATDLRAKNLTDLMSRSWFHLGKRKRTEPIRHIVGDQYVYVSAPNIYGIANVYDGDLLIYGISQLRHNLNMGLDFNPVINFAAADFYEFTGRRNSTKKISGADYQRIYDSLRRLKATVLDTNIRPEHIRRGEVLNWLNSASYSEDTTAKKHLGFSMELPRWITEPIKKSKPDILTINPEYFKIESGIERFLYQFIRKSTGYRDADHGWFESLKNLHSKSGSSGTKEMFWHRLIKTLKQRDFKILEYHVSIIQKGRERGLKFHRSPFFPKQRHLIEIEHAS